MNHGGTENTEKTAIAGGNYKKSAGIQSFQCCPFCLLCVLCTSVVHCFGGSWWQVTNLPHIALGVLVQCSAKARFLVSQTALPTAPRTWSRAAASFAGQVPENQ